MTEPTRDLKDLKKHFHPSLIKWRVGATNSGRGKPLAYIDARDVMRRLDGVLGPENWSDHYEETNSGRVICRLSINISLETEEFGRWITKSDGAGSTGFEGEKGAISDAFKRAAVKWGIGQYLYNVETPWIELSKGKYMPNDFNGEQYLPEWKEK